MISKEYNDIEDIIDNVVKNTCIFVEDPKCNIYRYVKPIKNNSIFTLILNTIYNLFSSMRIIEYTQLFHIENVFCEIDKKMLKIYGNSLQIFDNCLKINNKLKIPYEYIKTVCTERDIIILYLIPNERNITNIYMKTLNNKYILKQILSNMKYHIQYNPLHNDAIKYFQKFHKKPLEVIDCR